MSHLDDLAADLADAIADAFLTDAADLDGDGVVDVTNPAQVDLIGRFNLIPVAEAVALKIVAAGWVHADELQDGAV